MADPYKFSVTKKAFSYDIDILNVTDGFRNNTENKCAIAVQEFLGAHSEIEVELLWDFSDASKEVKKLAYEDKKRLQRDYSRLEKKWAANLRNKLPRWFGFADDDIFISSENYKTIFRQKPTPAPIPDDSRYVVALYS